MWKNLTIFLAALTLIACATTEPPPVINEEAAEEIRAQARQDDGVIEVVPLADGDVQILLERANAAEARGELEEARRLLIQAADLAPRDPRIWQHLAEIELETGAFQAAIEHALKSFHLGPQVGPLCSRNWLTVAEAQSALENAHLASAASERAEACPVRARERL
ncbi:MAG: tetratricopeptide repeat protein [Xanthomonadales bacterium]|nr:tetratricopeptide repeat protein [Xanthomonadales bacterium]